MMIKDDLIPDEPIPEEAWVKSEPDISILCSITDNEWEQFRRDYQGISPCQEYGTCELCPFNEEAGA